MIERPLDRRTPLPPQLGRRIEILGLVAFVLFAIVVLRLWYLQVLTGSANRALANSNVVRRIAIPPPRGLILDRDGRVIAGVRPAAVAAIVCSELPLAPSRRAALYTALGTELAIPAKQIAAAVTPCDTYSPIAIEADIPSSALIYLKEHEANFPGVIEEQTSVRDYRYGDLGAQTLGFVHQLNSGNLKDQNFKGVAAGDIVGQAGLEYQYDRYLRGTDGVQRIQVDSLGNATGTPLPSTPAIAGDDLKTSIDLPLEQEGMAAIATGMKLAKRNGYAGDAAAFVALDPRNGEVLATGSLPSYDPNVLSKPFIATRTYDAQAAGDAFINRAISSAYPTGSTFKPIAALAALQSGLITPGTLLGATPSSGCKQYFGQTFCNSNGADFGANDLDKALEVSEDTYFYQIGAEANARGEVLQTTAKELGLGGLTGIDVPGEAAGDVPDAAWVRQQDAAYRAANCGHGRHGLDCPAGPYPPWTPGQDIQLATGQGYLDATPLQMAVAYSALANGGKIVTPHIGLQVENPNGQLLVALPPPAPRRLPARDDAYLQTILAGLHLAAQGASGTSDDVFGNFPRTIYGKTGTAQTVTGNARDDQSWYVAYAPDATRPIVVAVTVEKGGYGDEAAAPAARLILAKWFNLPETVVRGSSTSR
jgi:penicillin-binding protein 2